MNTFETFETLLNELEQEILKAKKATFSPSEVLVNKSRMQDLIARLRSNFPAVITDAKQIKENEAKIIGDAQAYADKLVADATAKSKEMVDQTDIIKRAKEDATAMRTEAEENYKRSDYESRALAFQILDGAEKTLVDSLNIITEKKRTLIEK